MAAFQIIALDTVTPQLRAPGTGDTYSAPRAIALAPETLTGSSATTSLDITQTWNTTGTPSAIRLNVTDTASNAASRLLDLQVNGSSVLTFRKDSNLGIGTATPVVTANYGGLTVNGTTGGIVSLTAGNVEYLRMFGRSTDSWVFTTAGVPLVLGTNSAERMRISDTGNVGIGTSSPTLLFQVGTRGGMNSSGVFQWGAALTGNNRGVLSWDTNVAIIGAPQNLVFCTNSESAERMRLDTSGNLGIGTASPGARLHASGGNVFITNSGTYAEPATIAGVLAFDNVSGELTISARSNGGNTLTRFFTSNAGTGAERMRITSAGDVGIGTASPNFRVEVRSSGATTLAVGSSGATTLLRGFAINDGATEFASFKQRFDTGELQIVSGYGGWGGLTTFSTNGAERMRIDSSGNVGIGTGGTGTLNGVTLANNGIISFQDAGGTARNSLQFLSGELRHGGAGAGLTSQTFYTSAAERMRINAAGDVGIGTASPAVRLAVEGSGNTQVNIAKAGTTGYLALGANSATVSQISAFRSDSPFTATLAINPDGGNVGIGTNAPSARLDVNGTGNFSDNVLISRTNTAGSITSLTVTNAGTTSAYAGVTINSGTVSSQFFNDAAGNAVVAGAILRTTSNHPLVIGTNNTERMRISSAGDVGIGTSSPTFKLQVEVDTNAAAGTFVRNLNTGTGASGVVTASSAVGGISMRAHSAANSAWPNASLLISDSAFTGGMNFFQSGANPIGLWTNGTERIRITGTGNVGVGTTSPNAAALLEVASTTSGFLPPRMTTTQRDAISTPPNGLILYNTTTDKLQVRAAGTWVDLH